MSYSRARFANRMRTGPSAARVVPPKQAMRQRSASIVASPARSQSPVFQAVSTLRAGRSAAGL